MNLTTDFDQAARQLKQGMGSLAVRLKNPLFFPALELSHWRGKRNNCYNFALNRHTDDFLQPGQCSDPDLDGLDPWFPLNLYAPWVLERVEADGLRPLSHEFLCAVDDCTESERLVALFIRGGGTVMNCDFHWMALRRVDKNAADFVWAHKDGGDDAAICRTPSSRSGHSNIFELAAQNNYKNFAGYYAVPVSLEAPPVSNPVSKRAQIPFLSRVMALFPR